MSGIQLQTANGAISGQRTTPATTSSVSASDASTAGAARAWRPAHRHDQRRPSRPRTRGDRPPCAPGRERGGGQSPGDLVRSMDHQPDRFVLRGEAVRVEQEIIGSAQGRTRPSWARARRTEVLIAVALLRCWTGRRSAASNSRSEATRAGAVGDLDDVLIAHQRVGMLADDIELGLSSSRLPSGVDMSPASSTRSGRNLRNGTASSTAR